MTALVTGVSGHFDVVVIGSGFGGSVAAYRAAEAGRRVCVLERGKAYPPGSFARSPADMGANFWDPSEGHHGLFDVWSFKGLEVLISSGLGGGSLIYANVLLRKDERWFVKDEPHHSGPVETWPVTRADLDPHYEQVERMLHAQRLPFDVAGYELAKTAALRDASIALGQQWELVPLAVRFANDGRAPVPSEPLADEPYGNLHGAPRHTCRLCGECDIGCNDGAKSTLDHTYLSAAAHAGAVISVRSEVRRFQRRPDGSFEIGYVVHDPSTDGHKTDTRGLPLHTITATKMVLAAGTLGSTYLLLRNRAAFPELSPALGTRFSGNGDLLGFVMRARDPNGAPRRMNGSRGPVITSAMRLPDHTDTGDPADLGAYIEDAGFPGFAEWLVEGSQAPGLATRAALFAWRRLVEVVKGKRKSDLSAEVAWLLGPAVTSSTSLPLLGMGRDVPDGVMTLSGDELENDWTIKTSAQYFSRLQGRMGAIAAALDACFEANPLSLLKRVITVHPLGGCPMGRERGEGVVDGYGEVFGVPGLFVADGSVMPGPVGANPSLTIAAFADRMADRL